MQNKKQIFFLAFILFSLPVQILSAESFITKEIKTEHLPVIPNLQSRDVIFREYSEIVDENYRLIAKGEEPLLLFFKTVVPKETNLLALAARCNIPYETIATLNHIESNSSSLEGKTVILSTVPGLFINLESKDALQVILKSRCGEILQNTKVCYNLMSESFSFLQNERFTPTERAYFLDTSLGLPIDTSLSWVSSSFGLRKSPISGEWKDHKGVDFAAPEGVPVYAVKNGTISLAKSHDLTFGNYIIIKHDSASMTSVYAHLSSMNVKAGDKVKRGDIIGYVGSTGKVTGPHLHFEIRFGGVAEDPEKLLPSKKR